MTKRLRPDDLRKLRQKADEAFTKNDWKKALELYRDFALASPFDVRVTQRMGDLYRKTKQVPAAIVEYKRAANYYVAEGYWAKAIAMNKLLLEVAPDDADVRDQIARLYAKQAERKPEAAIEVAHERAVPFATGLTYGNEIDLDPWGHEPYEKVSTPVHTLGEPVRQAVKIPLFSSLTPEEFVSVLQRLTIRRFPEGALVCEEGDLGHSMFVLSEGIVEVFTRDRDGTRITLARLTGGSFFGEYSLLTERPRNASVSAKTEVEALEITATDLDAIAAAHPGVRAALEQYLQRRMVQTIMAKSPVFHVLDEAERAELSERMTARPVRAGETVMREGDLGEEMYFIKSGSVALTSDRPIGAIAIATLRPGDFFGEMGLLSGKPRTATAKAAEDTELFCLTRVAAAKVLRGNRDVLVLLQSKMKERARETYETLESYAEAQHTLSLV